MLQTPIYRLLDSSSILPFGAKWLILSGPLSGFDMRTLKSADIAVSKVAVWPP